MRQRQHEGVDRPVGKVVATGAVHEQEPIVRGSSQGLLQLLDVRLLVSVIGLEIEAERFVRLRPPRGPGRHVEAALQDDASSPIGSSAPRVAPVVHEDDPLVDLAFRAGFRYDDTDLAPLGGPANH